MTKLRDQLAIFRYANMRKNARAEAPQRGSFDGTGPGCLPAKVLQILLDDLFQRRRLRQAEGNGAGAIDGDGPVVHDALDAGIEGIDDRTEFQAALPAISRMTDSASCGVTRCAGRPMARSSLNRSAGTSCNAMSDSMTVR